MMLWHCRIIPKEGNTDTMIIITEETTFVFKINSWLARVACVARHLPCSFVRCYFQAPAMQTDSW